MARALLGKLLVRTAPDGEVRVRLTEVEAYLGPDDPACHTRSGLRSRRNRSMWGDAGRVYVYRVYGLHHCLNVVTVGGVGEAVLVRGGTVEEGRELARSRRAVPKGGGHRRGLTDGPGKLCQALAVTLADDGIDLCAAGAAIAILDDGLAVPEDGVLRLPRVGVGYAGDAAAWPLRFVWRPGHPGQGREAAGSTA